MNRAWCQWSVPWERHHVLPGGQTVPRADSRCRNQQSRFYFCFLFYLYFRICRLNEWQPQMWWPVTSRRVHGDPIRPTPPARLIGYVLYSSLIGSLDTHAHSGTTSAPDASCSNPNNILDSHFFFNLTGLLQVLI